jgi:hypothetical protein
MEKITLAGAVLDFVYQHKNFTTPALCGTAAGLKTNDKTSYRPQ